RDCHPYPGHKAVVPGCTIERSVHKHGALRLPFGNSGHREHAGPPRRRQLDGVSRVSTVKPGEGSGDGDRPAVRYGLDGSRGCALRYWQIAHAAVEKTRCVERKEHHRGAMILHIPLLLPDRDRDARYLFEFTYDGFTQRRVPIAASRERRGNHELR